MKELTQETLERIGLVYKRSIEMSPLRKPKNEKSLAELISFRGFHADEVIDPDLKNAMDHKSNTLINTDMLKKLIDTQNIINEKNKIGDIIKSMNEKITHVNGKIANLEDERKEYKKIIEVLSHYDHLLVTVK